MNKRKTSYDLMRIIAIFGVITIHTTSLNWYTNTIDNKWVINNFLNCMAYPWTVPLFLTISGALLLNKNINIQKIYTKYIPRILLCFIVWNFIYFFHDHNINFTNLLLELKTLISGKSFIHLWYLQTLIGIYILLPILTKLVNNLDKKMLLYLLIIIGIITIGFQTINMFFGINLNQYTASYNVIPFSTHIFYFLLGYYINKYPIKDKKLSILLLIDTIILLALLALYSTHIALKKEIAFNYAHIGSIIATFATISIFSFINLFTQNKHSKIITKLGELTFGVYLLHYLIIFILLSHNILPNSTNPLNIMIYILFVMIVSYITCYILSKIPIIKKIIGL